MSIKHGLLALLEQAPMYGYQLRERFEQSTGATWPLNIGQVYTTLSRLERDGLVEAGLPDDEGRVVYRITAEGQAEVREWFASPVPRTPPPRDELAIKLAFAVTVPGVDVPSVIQRQRSATMSALQDYTRLKRDASDLAWGLVLDSLVFQAEAEIRWLDHCEARLRRAAREGSRYTAARHSTSEEHTAARHSTSEEHTAARHSTSEEHTAARHSTSEKSSTTGEKEAAR